MRVGRRLGQLFLLGLMATALLPSACAGKQVEGTGGGSAAGSPGAAGSDATAAGKAGASGTTAGSGGASSAGASSGGTAAAAGGETTAAGKAGAGGMTAGSGGASNAGASSGGTAGSNQDMFACGSAYLGQGRGPTACARGREYCVAAFANGGNTLRACRPYPAGCSSCSCAKADGLKTIQMAPTCEAIQVGTLGCFDGSQTPVDDDATIPDLQVLCQTA